LPSSDREEKVKLVGRRVEWKKVRKKVEKRLKFVGIFKMESRFPIWLSSNCQGSDG
jgi:hypothetical protein